MMTEAHSYVLMTYNRCGSTYLAQLLGSTGSLGRPEDWFNGSGMRERGVADYPLDRESQLALARRDGTSANGMFGVKLSPRRFDELAGFAWLRELRGASFIHLLRQDRLARAISEVRAQQTRQYRSTSAARGTPRYDARRIVNALAAQAVDEGRTQQYFAMNGIRPLELTYEQIGADERSVLDRVARFLGVEEPIEPNRSQIALRVQRDELNEEWRRRFVAEHESVQTVQPLVASRCDRLLRWLRTGRP